MQPDKTIELTFCSKQGHLFVALLGIFFCILMITNGSFNFFMGGELPLMYNYMFLSLLEGRTDVPYQVVGLEGFYREDGLVFAYFGYVPALVRALFHPFVDLKTVPVSRATIVAPLIISGLVAHYLIYYVARKSNAEIPAEKRIDVFLGAIAVWFCSPITFLTANSMAYHEAFVYSLLVILLYLLVVLKYLIFSEHKKFFPFLILGILSALLVHLRPHVAFVVYLSTCAIMLYFLLREKPGIWAFIRDGIKYCSIPLLIMFLSGSLYLYLNYLRWGDPFMTINYARMGYVIYIDGITERFEAFINMGILHPVRFPPNFLFHHFAFPHLHALLKLVFDTGYIRLAWPQASNFFIWGIWYGGLIFLLPKCLPRNIQWNKKISLSVILALMTLLIFIAINCFPTVSVRYKTEMWYFLFAAYLLFVFRKKCAGNKQLDSMVMSAFLLVSILSTVNLLWYYSQTMMPDTKGFFYPDYSVYGPLIIDVFHEEDILRLRELI